MAIEHHAAGCTHVWFNGNEYGLSRDGVDISIDPRWNDIPSDCYGGASGVPSDSQLLGATARVTAELTKFESARVRAAASMDPNALLPAGLGDVQLPAIGSFVRQGPSPLGGLLDLRGQAFRLSFPFSFLRMPQSFNMGSRASFYTIGWECWLSNETARVLMQYLAAI